MTAPGERDLVLGLDWGHAGGDVSAAMLVEKRDGVATVVDVATGSAEAVARAVSEWEARFGSLMPRGLIAEDAFAPGPDDAPSLATDAGPGDAPTIGHPARAVCWMHARFARCPCPRPRVVTADGLAMMADAAIVALFDAIADYEARHPCPRCAVNHGGEPCPRRSR